MNQQRLGGKLHSRLAALLGAVLFLLSGLPRAQAVWEDGREAIGAIVSRQCQEAGAESVQAWLDGALTEGAGRTSEWYVLALSQYGDWDLSAYRAALERRLAESEGLSASTREKLALVYLACGEKNDLVRAALDEAPGRQGIMSWVFALHLFNNGAESGVFTRDGVAEELISRQLPDGGWALMGDTADVDVTAMTLQALAPLCEEREDVADSAERAIRLLADRQLPDGGFQSLGAASAESAAQVGIALCALGVDPREDARFLKNGRSVYDALLDYRLPDGSFAHAPGGESNQTATMEALCALVALARLEAGQGSLYLLNGPGPLAEEAAALDRPLRAGNEKLLPLLIVAALALCWALLLWLRGKRHWKNYVFILLLALLASGVLLHLDIRRPEEYYGAAAPTPGEGSVTVSLTIRCDTVAGRTEYAPADGVLLPEEERQVPEGSSVYELLLSATRESGIPLESSRSVVGGVYVAGIGHLYEYDFGDLSGWMYRVNGALAEDDCGSHILAAGDRVEWLYTCALGSDFD